MKHNHYDIYKCSCYNEEFSIEKLHEQLNEVKSIVQDLLQSLEAEDNLKKGFKGMGYNILQETASQKLFHIRQLKRKLSLHEESND